MIKFNQTTKTAEEPEVFQGVLGKSISLGTKVVYTQYKTNNLYKGAFVGKITDKNIYIYQSVHQSYSSRRVPKTKISKQLISMEDKVDESVLDNN